MSGQTLGQMLMVGVGGFLGTCLRFLVGGWAQRAFADLSFPVGTLAVNLLGCLGIGIVAAVAEGRGPEAGSTYLFLMVGLLGGFTTYSAFANESFGLLKSGSHGWAFLHLGAHVVFGLVAVALGGLLARWWLGAAT